MDSISCRHWELGLEYPTEDDDELLDRIEREITSISDITLRDPALQELRRYRRSLRHGQAALANGLDGVRGEL